MRKAHRLSDPKGSTLSLPELMADADRAGKKIARNGILCAVAAGADAETVNDICFDFYQELLGDLVKDGLSLDLATQVVARVISAVEAELAEIGAAVHENGGVQ